MASYSDAKNGLDNIAGVISDARQRLTQVKTTAGTISASLANLPTDYATAIATINAYPSNTTNPAEQVAKAELAKMTTEFSALKSVADAIAAADLG